MKEIFAIIILIIGLYGYLYFYKKTKDVINPVGLTMAIWGIVAGAASLHLTALETKWSTLMYLSVLLFMMMVFIGGLTSYKRVKIIKRSLQFTDMYIILSRLIFIFSLFCTIVIWKKTGFRLAFQSNDVDKKLWFEESNSIIASGNYFLNFISLNSFAELLYREKIKKRTKFYLILTICCSLFYDLLIAMSRGSLIIPILGALYIYTRKYKIKVRTIIIFGIIIVTGLLVMMTFRLTRVESMVYVAIPGHRALSSLYTYTALNLENLNKLINQGPTWGIAFRTFHGIWRFLFPWIDPLEPNIVTYGFFNACPLCYSFYDDLGIVGIVLYSFLFYYVIGYLYYKSSSDRRYILLLACLQKPIWTMFFGNYFTEARAYLLPYLIEGFLIFTMRYSFSANSKKNYVSLTYMLGNKKL